MAPASGSMTTSVDFPGEAEILEHLAGVLVVEGRHVERGVDVEIVVVVVLVEGQVDFSLLWVFFE